MSEGFSVELHYPVPGTTGNAYLTLKSVQDGAEAVNLGMQFQAQVNAGTLGAPGSAVYVHPRPALPAPPHDRTETGWEVWHGQESHGMYATYHAAFYVMVHRQLAAPSADWSIKYTSQPAPSGKPFGGFGMT